MIVSEAGKLSGALYFCSKRADFWASLKTHTNLVSQLSECRAGWFEFRAFPSESWDDQTRNEQELAYKFWARRGGEGRFLLTSTKTDFVDRLLMELSIAQGVDTPSVDIPGLVDDLLQSPRTSPYSLGVVWARIEGFGQAFRTVAMFGNDLGASSLFSHDILPMAVPYRISLRLSHRAEVLSIGSRGEINFALRDETSFEEVDAALRTIARELKRLDWSF